VKYAFIKDQAKHYPAVHLCRLLEVKRSAYYDWETRGPKVIPAGELALRRRMKELFAGSRQSLGSRRMARHLCAEGFAVGRERARRRMKTLNLKVKAKRKYKVTTDSKHRLPVAPNVLNRQFFPKGPNQVWGTDITYCAPILRKCH